MLHNRLAQLREERAEGDRGFTLIELLVVVVIIGVLIAIAIPVYLNYTKGANDKSAQSDLRGAVSALEQCNSDNGVYPTATTTGTGASATGTTTGCTSGVIKLSKGTTFTYFDNTTHTAYIAETVNSSGSGGLYCYASSAGGSVTKVTSTTTAVAAFATSCPA